MSTQNSLKHAFARWSTYRVTSSLTFLIISVLIEYGVVLYAINLGVKEKPENLFNFQIPGTNGAIGVSPLFHLVPAAVIIVLMTVWINLAKIMNIRRIQPQKWKTGASSKQDKTSTRREQRKLFGGMGSGVLGRTMKNMLIVILVFSALILAVSLLTYPNLIYWTISNAYLNNPLLLNFVKSTGQSLASVGGAFSAINGVVLSASPGLRDFALGLGGVIRPLAELDNAGKYLLFQNAAAWISAIMLLLYGEYKTLHRKR